MKKSAWLLIAAVLMAAISNCADENVMGSGESPAADIDTSLKVQKTVERNIDIYEIVDYGIVVIKIPHVSAYLYMQRPTRSLEQIGKDSNYAVVVNGSYFDAFYDDPASRSGASYKHAGYLKINNTVLEEMKADRQLSRLFAYNSMKKSVGFFPLEKLGETAGYDLVFQTGPQIISKNQVDSAGIDSSINGNRVHPRTAFGSVDGEELYVIIATINTKTHSVGITLKDLARLLRTSGIFRKELNVVNFDGGFSTSLYVRNHPEFNYSSSLVKPILLCVK